VNAKQLLAALEKFDDQCSEAFSEGEDFPVIEAVVPVAAQKILQRKYGEVPMSILEGINSRIEAVNEAMSDLDHELEVLKYVATGLADTEKLSQQIADMEAPVHVTPTSETEHTDERKVKGE